MFHHLACECVYICVCVLYKTPYSLTSRLRAGMELNVASWENCAMYVQDLESGANATAALTQQEANNFRDMCKTFTSASFHSQTIDAYLLNLSQARAARTGGASLMKMSYELSAVSLSVVQRFKDTVSNVEKQMDGVGTSSSSYIGDHSISATGSNAKIVDSTLNHMKKLEDAINVDEIVNSAKSEMNRILSRSANTIHNEQKIINMLTCLLPKCGSTITAIPYGSVTYGLVGSKTNFNIAINTGMDHTKESLANLMKTLSQQKDFEVLSRVKSNRVQSEYLKILHKESGTECAIQFVSSAKIMHYYSKQAKIVLDYMGLHPMCKCILFFHYAIATY